MLEEEGQLKILKDNYDEIGNKFFLFPVYLSDRRGRGNIVLKFGLQKYIFVTSCRKQRRENGNN